MSPLNSPLVSLCLTFAALPALGQEATRVPAPVAEVLRKARAAGDLKPFLTEHEEGEKVVRVRLSLTQAGMTVASTQVTEQGEQHLEFLLTNEGGLRGLRLSAGPKGARRPRARVTVRDGVPQVETAKPDGTWTPPRRVPVGSGIPIVLAHVVLPRLWKHVPQGGLSFRVQEEGGAEATLAVSNAPKARPEWAEKATHLVEVKIQNPQQSKRAAYLVCGTRVLGKQEPSDKEWIEVRDLPVDPALTTDAPPGRSGK